MRKRGFTLIELLAVIVILAIIALIATPIIMNVIENTKEASYDRSVEGVLHSANILAMDMKVTEDLELDKNIYDKIVNQISGDRPDTGQVYVNKKGEIALSLRYGDYCYTKSYGEKSYYKEKTEENCITPFYYLKKAIVIDADKGEQLFLEGPINRNEIEKIVTLTTNIVPDDIPEENVWDVGVDKNNNPIKDKVKLWYKDEDNNGLYEVYIGQEGGVKANPNSSGLFSYLNNLTEIDLNKLDTSNVTTMTGMLHGCNNLTNLDLSSFDTSKVKGMGSMFSECPKLETLKIDNFNTSNVVSMNHMFYGCEGLTELNLNHFNTSNVVSMNHMFYGCKGLTELNLNHFNTSKVTSMGSMFNGCSKLETLKIDNFDTNNVTIMSRMFRECYGLKSLNLDNFNTENVTEMDYMFFGNAGLTTLDLTSFDTNKVTTMANMFEGSQNLIEIIVGENWKEADNNTNMFKGCGTDHVTVKS